MGDQPPVVDLNREIEPAPVVELPGPRHDAVPTPIVQPIEDIDAEVVVQSNWENRHEPREGQTPGVVTPTTLEGGGGTIGPIDSQDDFFIANAGRLLQFKGYIIEDLTHRMRRLNITETTDPVFISDSEIPGPCPSTPTASLPSESTTIVTEVLRLDTDTNDFTGASRIAETPLLCPSTSTASVSTVDTKLASEVPLQGLTDTSCIAGLPLPCSSATTASVSPANTTTDTEVPLDIHTSDFTDATRIPLPSSSTAFFPSVNSTIGVPAGQLFSNLEHPFDEKNFTYLSALEGYEPPYKCLLPNHPRPSSKNRLLSRFGTIEERLKAKMEQRRQRDDSLTLSETPRIIRAQKTKPVRRHPYQIDFSPLPSTNHRLGSNQDPFGKY